jgi:hypothetical protein
MKSQLCTSPHVQSTPDDMLLDSKATFSFPNGPLEKSMSCDQNKPRDEVDFSITNLSMI